MYRPWSCSSCVGWLAIAILIRATEAMHDSEYEIHQINKKNGELFHPRRDLVCENEGWYLCGSDVGGGCCPDNYSCGTASCYATTAGPSTACNHIGYYNCPIQAGPGTCCPVGKICGDSGTCDPPAGESAEVSCPASYYACDTTIAYGCCMSGMACGDGFCYEASPSTFTVSDVITTTNTKGQTVTRTVSTTTVFTPTPDGTATPGVTVQPQLVLSTQSKMEAVETNTSGGSGSGLTQPQLGGIIGGITGLLIIVVVAAWLIIRRLKKTQQAAEEAEASRRESSNNTRREKKSSYGQTVTEVNDYDIDPLQSPDLRPSHLRTGSDTSARDSSPAATSRMRTSGTSTPYGVAWPGQYNPVPTSDATDSRHHSVESFQAYDVRYSGQSMQTAQQQQRASYDSQATSHQGRHMSHTSELEGMHGISELDIDSPTATARRRSSSGAGAFGRPSLSQSRRSSAELPASPRMRSESASGTGLMAGTGLVTVNEVNELHGYYGPQNSAVGQTAARLARNQSSVAPTPIDPHPPNVQQ